MGKGSSAPPPPDPTVTANAQAAANKDTAITQAQLNMVDQYTPYGSTVYSQVNNTAPVFNQAGYDFALAAYNRGLENNGRPHFQQGWGMNMGGTMPLQAPRPGAQLQAPDPNAFYTQATDGTTPRYQAVTTEPRRNSRRSSTSRTRTSYLSAILRRPASTMRRASSRRRLTFRTTLSSNRLGTATRASMAA